jgi:hypothetical protein
MSGSCEWGDCDYCGNNGPVERTYFRYDIKCECCNNKHFEIVWHCSKCQPKDPGIRKIKLNNEERHKTENI